MNLKSYQTINDITHRENVFGTRLCSRKSYNSRLRVFLGLVFACCVDRLLGVCCGLSGCGEGNGNGLCVVLGRVDAKWVVL